MYSNSTYSKDSQLAGTVFKLKIIDDGDIKKASPNSFYLKYDVGYYKDFIEDMKEKYKLKPADKINKIMDNIQMVRTFLDVLK